jgi:hypothetical protein
LWFSTFFFILLCFFCLSHWSGGGGPGLRPDDTVKMYNDGLFITSCSVTTHSTDHCTPQQLTNMCTSLHNILFHFLTGWNRVSQKCKLMYLSTKCSSWFICTWNRFMFHNDF